MRGVLAFLFLFLLTFPHRSIFLLILFFIPLQPPRAIREQKYAKHVRGTGGTNGRPGLSVYTE